MPGMLGAAAPNLSDQDPLPPAHDVWSASIGGLEALYRSEAPGLIRFLSRRVPSDQAHDLVQRVFLRMAARFGNRAVNLAAPGAYLREATSNLLKDDARSARRGDASAHIPLDDRTPSFADPIAALEARDRLARIERAVARLKPLTRQIFLARRLDGYSYAEIAQRTGLSVKGVEKQMSRALRQLGRHLRDD